MMIENVILGNLLNNKEYIHYLPYIKNNYFMDQSHKEIHKFIIRYVKKYKKIPSKSAMSVMIEKSKLNEGIYNAVCDKMQEVYDCYERVDLDWLVTESENWAKERSYNNALTECVYLREKGQDASQSLDIMKKALSVNFKSDLGIEYLTDAESQYEYYNTPENEKIPFGIDCLNYLTDGGYARKTLNIVQAGINVGKTTFLLNIGKQAVDLGLNVTFFTHEIDPRTCAYRSDVLFTGESFYDVRTMNKNKYLDKIREIRDSTRGKIFFKDMSSSHTPQHHRHYINELETQKDIKTDVCIFDYLGITSTSRLPDNARRDSNTYYKNVAEESRDLMKEKDMAGWSAVQFNRGGQSSDDVEFADCADSIAIMNTIDLNLAITQPEAMKGSNVARGKLLKSRYSNKDEKGIISIGLNNSKQLFYDVDGWDDAIDPEQKILMDKISGKKSKVDKSNIKKLKFGD